MKRICAVVGLLLLVAHSHAAPPWSSFREAVAIQGFDPVAYQTRGEAVRGSSRFVHDWGGVSWFFSSSEHRDLFVASPEKYAPQFGGFCALSVANGKSARGGGDAFTVHNGKLYLNFDKSVMEQFRRDVAGNVSKAEGHWPGIKTRLESQ